MNNTNRKHEWTVISVLGVIFSFIFGLIPIGIGIILYKMGLFDAIISSFNQSGATAETTRAQKYKAMAAAADVLSIEHMAAAVGISYESCLREVQKMVAAGQFGKYAYVNYVDKTLVLVGMSGVGAANKSPAASTAGKKATATATTATKTAATATKTAASATTQPSSGTDQYKTMLQRLFSGTPAVLTGIGIFLLFVAAILGLGAESTVGVVASLSFLLGGIGLLGAQWGMRRRAKRAVTYVPIIGNKGHIELSELSRASGESEKTVRRDLEVMIEKGFFGESAYIDSGRGLLVLDPSSVPNAGPEITVPQDDADRYTAVIREIRQVNAQIPDPDLTAKIDEIEDYTARIFKAVREKPEKEPQIKSFMSYYLPTTLKLLHSYADFDQAGVSGTSVDSAKAEIERILDMLVEGFKKQLDKLYETEAMDISTDINVLENMLRRDGLKQDGSGFSQAAAGGR